MEAEKRQILEMVRDGKLTVEEAQKIMEAMDQGDEGGRSATASDLPGSACAGERRRWL